MLWCGYSTMQCETRFFDNAQPMQCSHIDPVSAFRRMLLSYAGNENSGPDSPTRSRSIFKFLSKPVLLRPFQLARSSATHGSRIYGTHPCTPCKFACACSVPCVGSVPRGEDIDPIHPAGLVSPLFRIQHHPLDINVFNTNMV